MSIKSFSLFILVVTTLINIGCSNPEEEKLKADLATGEAIVKKNCLACHTPGINGAPIIGNEKMWATRLAKGQEVLVKNATNGFGLMPAKGGKVHLTDEDMNLAVNYMLSQIETK